MTGADPCRGISSRMNCLDLVEDLHEAYSPFVERGLVRRALLQALLLLQLLALSNRPTLVVRSLVEV